MPKKPTILKAATLMVRGNLQTFNAQGLKEEVPVVVTATVMFSKNAVGTFKPKEKSEHPTTFQAHEIRMVIAGRETCTTTLLPMCTAWAVWMR